MLVVVEKASIPPEGLADFLAVARETGCAVKLLADLRPPVLGPLDLDDQDAPPAFTEQQVVSTLALSSCRIAEETAQVILVGP